MYSQVSLMRNFLESPGSVFNGKIIRRMADLATSDPGTEITFPGAFEIALFADYPVSIRFNNSAAWVAGISDLHVRGFFDKIFVKKLWADSPGRLVIYAGYPELGPSFKREDPRFKTRFSTQVQINSWPAGTIWESQEFQLPYATGVPAEAWYLWSFDAVRGIGDISKMEYIETETGTSNVLYSHQPETVSARLVLEKDFPIRLSSAGKIKLTGSDEVLTTIVAFATFSII